MSRSETPASAAAVAAWQRYDAQERRLSAHVSHRMLDLAQLKPGSKVLDIASGRGEPALRAAARVAPDGFVVATDISDAMLEFARARAKAEAVTNLSTCVADGETLAGIAEHAFDAALCRWGLMFFPHPRRALEAVRRCLRPRGFFVAAVWAAPDDVPWWSMPRQVLARHAAAPDAGLTVPGLFRHAAAGALRAGLESTGFAVGHEESLTTPLVEASTPEGLIDWCLTFGLAELLARHPKSVGDAWRRDMQVEAERHRDADGRYRLGGLTRLVVAQAP